MPAPPTSPLAPAPRRLPPAGHPASLPVALLLAVRQLADPRVLRILGKSLLVTLALFAALAWAGWTLLDGGLRRAGLADTLFAGAGDLRQLAAGLLVGIGLWLGWRIVAMAVIQFFADEVVEAVEARHYPAVAAAAHAVPLRRQAAAGLKAAARALLVNLAVLPFALALLVTGIGTALLFWLVNALLLARELEEMVWLRHRPLSGPEANARAPVGRLRFVLLGAAIAALLAVPFVNLLAPVLGAAAATHLLHRTQERFRAA